MKILVQGASGMLGNSVFRFLSSGNGESEVWGTLRSPEKRQFFPDSMQDRLFDGLESASIEKMYHLIKALQPDVIINCIGMIKQSQEADDPLAILPVNALFPHQLARFCEPRGTRVIHISTDCVFSGNKGGYTEDDLSDVSDLYGRSKSIGELISYENAVTLRTSIIGHELTSSLSLMDWFLSQQGKIKGYEKAIFSGLPTIELAEVIGHYVISNPQLQGLYHVAAEPINKYALLKLVAEQYQKTIEIEADNSVVIDRSLNASRFNQATGYVAPRWKALIERLHQDYLTNYAG